MVKPVFLRLGLTLLIIAVLVIGTPLVTTRFAPPGALVAYAGGNDNDADAETDDNDEDRVLRGQVIAMCEDCNPPELTVAQQGGDITARVIDRDEIPRNGLRVGDHARFDGEYVQGGIFDVYEIDIQVRCCPKPNENEDDENDND